MGTINSMSCVRDENDSVRSLDVRPNGQPAAVALHRLDGVADKVGEYLAERRVIVRIAHIIVDSREDFDMLLCRTRTEELHHLIEHRVQVERASRHLAIKA